MGGSEEKSNICIGKIHLELSTEVSEDTQRLLKLQFTDALRRFSKFYGGYSFDIQISIKSVLPAS